MEAVGAAIAAGKLAEATFDAVGAYKRQRTISIGSSSIPASVQTQLSNVDDDICNVKTNKVIITLNRRKKVNRGQLSSPYTFYNYINGFGETPEGKQNIICPFYMYALKHFTDGGSSQNEFSWPNNVFDLDPNTKTTGGDTGTVIGAGQVSKHFGSYLRVCRQVANFVNLGAAPMQVNVLWCLAKCNTVRDPYEEWIYQLNQQRLGQGNAQQPLYTGGLGRTAVGGNPFVEMPGLYPQACRTWTKTWKVVHTDRFNLAGGSQKEIRYDIEINKYADKDKMFALRQQGTTEVTDTVPLIKGVGGYTLIPMIIYRGHAIYDVGNGIPYVSYAKVKLGWIFQQKYTNIPVAFEDKWEYDRAFPQVITGGGFAEQKIMDTDMDTQNNTAVS